MLNNLDEILKILDNPNTDINERNRLAILASETKDKRVLSLLHKLIKDKNNENYRGSLVYALRNYPSEYSFELAIDLLINGNFEVAHEAFMIIDKIEYISGNHVLISYNKLLNFYSNQVTNMDKWRADLIKNTLELFE